MEETKNKLLYSIFTLRKAIGWIGILLPFVLLFGNYFVYSFGHFGEPADALKASISHYYYTPVSEVFTGALWVVAIFLFTYKESTTKGMNRFLSDNLLSNIAAAAAIGVSLFPTSSSNLISDNVRSFVSSGTIGNLHFFFAAMFFLALSILSVFNFKHASSPIQKRLHAFCGYGMILCLILIFIYKEYVFGKNEAFDNFKPVFWLETIALILFGVSWLVKGEVDFYFILRKMNLKK
jgi:hypothetical protein